MDKFSSRLGSQFDFLGRKSPFGANRQQERPLPFVVGANDLTDGVSLRVGNQDAMLGDHRFCELSPGGHLRNLHQMISSALFAGSDHCLSQFIELAGARVDNASGSRERN